MKVLKLYENDEQLIEKASKKHRDAQHVLYNKHAPKMLSICRFYIIDLQQAEEFSSELGKAKFRTTNLVFPFHLEFGPSKKIEKKNYFRYSTKKKLKIGLGAYAGLNLGNMQKLKYRVDGDRIKDKQKGEFEVSNFVYGLSSYVGFGSSALYVKYDLSPIFKNQTNKQNNISVGLRLDLD